MKNVSELLLDSALSTRVDRAWEQVTQTFDDTYAAMPTKFMSRPELSFHIFVKLLGYLCLEITDLQGDVVEIGVWKGKSLAFMRSLVDETTRVIGVDPCELEGQSAELDYFHQALFPDCIIVKRYSQFAIGNVLEISQKLKLLHIDGSHASDLVRSDFLLYEKFIIPGGYIVFDDYNDHEYSPEVRPTVDRMRELGLFRDYDDIGQVAGYENSYLLKKKAIGTSPNVNDTSLPPPATASDVADTLAQMRSQIARLEERAEYAARAAIQLEAEIYRTDYLLAKAEGILDMVDDFHAARQTAVYKQAFSIPNPLVTIIVTTMNRPHLLIDRCLKSLLEQTYSNLQILVIGDRCTDDTAERIAALGDARIQFYNLPVRGPYLPPGGDRWRVAGTEGVNFAMRRADGEFVAHLDEDDAATPDRIATLVAAAQTTQADLCLHRWHNQMTVNGPWHIIGNGRLEYGQVTTGSIFYHRWLARIPWDVNAYRIGEPGDCNRLRKIRMLRPKIHFVDSPLIYKFRDVPRPFIPQENEIFLIE